MFNPYSFQGATATLDPHAVGMNGHSRLPEYVNNSYANTNPNQGNYGAYGMPQTVPQHVGFATGFPTSYPYGTLPQTNYLPGVNTCGTPFGYAMPVPNFATPWNQFPQTPWGMNTFAPTSCGIPSFASIPTFGGFNPLAFQAPVYNPTFGGYPMGFAHPMIPTPATVPFNGGFPVNQFPMAAPVVNPAITNPYISNYGMVNPTSAFGYNYPTPAFQNTTAFSPWAGAISPFCFPGQFPVGSVNAFPFANPSVNPIVNAFSPTVGTTQPINGFNPFIQNAVNTFATSCTPWSSWNLNNPWLNSFVPGNWPINFNRNNLSSFQNYGGIGNPLFQSPWLNSFPFNCNPSIFQGGCFPSSVNPFAATFPNYSCFTGSSGFVNPGCCI